jgi:hypothetical protein
MPPNPQLVQDIMQARRTQQDNLEERLARLEALIENDSTLLQSRLEGDTGTRNDWANSGMKAQHSNERSNTEPTGGQATSGEARDVSHDTSNTYSTHEKAREHEHSGTGDAGAGTESGEAQEIQKSDP